MSSTLSALNPARPGRLVLTVLVALLASACEDSPLSPVDGGGGGGMSGGDDAGVPGAGGGGAGGAAGAAGAGGGGGGAAGAGGRGGAGTGGGSGSGGSGGSASPTDGPAAGCVQAGRTYPPGQSFPSADGCNTCACSAGGAVVCTLRACLPVDAGARLDTPAGGCTYAGKTYAPGASFASDDGCNVCTCAAGGAVGCTKRACAPCALPGALTFRDEGGLRAYADDQSLSADGLLQVTRMRRGSSAPLSCQHKLSCDQVTAVRRALIHPDVTAALAEAKPRLYGRDTRPVDGSIWILRMGQAGFDLGVGTVPDGLRELETLLRDLTTRTLDLPACAALKN